PVHRCTHLIICLLVWRLRALRKPIDYRLHFLFAGRQRSSAIARSVFYSHMSLAGHTRALPLIRESTITKFCAMHWLVRASDSAFPTKIEFFWKRLLACDAR